MPRITKIQAREIKDSRGKQTIEVFVETDKKLVSFAVPSGSSAGKHEAAELRDQDGGIARAVHNVNFVIAPELIGVDPLEQDLIDQKLLDIDGTGNKERLGANATIGTSIACAKAAAEEKEVPIWRHASDLAHTTPKFPLLLMNLINGGKHAEGRPAFQEYLIIPQGNDPRKSFELGVKIQQEIEAVLTKEGGGKLQQGDEGGFIIDTEDLEHPLEILEKAIKKTRSAVEVLMGIDSAASSFFNNKQYVIGEEKMAPAKDLHQTYKKLLEKYPITYLEDPFEEDDFDNFTKLQKASPQTLVTGDDLIATNPDRLKKAIRKESVTGIVIKPNQIGTLSETIEVVKLAQKSGIKCIVSHRSGETRDSFIADLAYGFGAYGLKAGSPIPMERRVKYERLVEIQSEQELI
jgi:enolase